MAKRRGRGEGTIIPRPDGEALRMAKITVRG